MSPRKRPAFGAMAAGDHRPDLADANESPRRPGRMVSLDAAARTEGDDPKDAATGGPHDEGRPSAPTKQDHRQDQANTAARRPRGRGKAVVPYTTTAEHRWLAEQRIETGVPATNLVRAAIALLRGTIEDEGPETIDADRLAQVVTAAHALDPVAGREKQINLYVTPGEHRFLARTKLDHGLSINDAARGIIALMRTDAQFRRAAVHTANTLPTVPRAS